MTKNSGSCPSETPEDAAQTPEALDKQKQEYLIEQTIKQALRVIYGDTARHTTGRIAKELATELVKRGVTLVGIPLLFWSLIERVS